MQISEIKYNQRLDGFPNVRSEQVMAKPELGDVVKIVGGEHAGHTGIIVRIDPDILWVGCPELGTDAIQVRRDQLDRGSEPAS